MNECTACGMPISAASPSCRNRHGTLIEIESPARRDYEYAVSAAGAWRATLADAWETYQSRQGTEQERVEASACEAVLTYLRLAPDLESAARSLAGRKP